MSSLLHAVLWNSGSAMILALAVFFLGLIPAIHRRPTLLHLLWFGVLLRLVAPSVVPVPILPGLSTTVPVESENTYVPPQNVSVTIAPAPTPTPIPEAVSVPPPVTAAPSVTVQPVVRPVPQWHVSTLLIIASLTGTTLMCLLCLYRLRRIRRLLRVAQDPPARLVELLEATAGAWRISRSLRVRLVNGLASPAVWIGWRRATILLPRHLVNSLDDDQWSCILSHELAHLVRRDHWFSFFGSIVLHLYWWNPVAWWAWREMLANQEASCDAAAISQNSTSRRLYAETLLQVVESWNGRSVFQPRVLLGFGNRSVLTRRFEMIADASVHPRIAAVTMIVLVLGALSFVCMPVRASMTDPAVAAPEKPADDDSRKAVQAVDPPRSAPRTAQRRRATFYVLVRKGFLGDRAGGIFWVAANRVVQGEIRLDDAAKGAVDGIVEQYARERSAAFDQYDKQLRELADLKEDDRKKRRTVVDEKFEGDIKQMTEKSMTQLKAVLSAEQFSRLQQIAWQAYGSEALATDRVLAKELKLTEDQIKKTAALKEEYLTKQRELDRAGMWDDEKLQKEHDRKAIELLTMDQQKTLAKLKGQPFDVALLMDPPVPRPQFSYYNGIFSIVKNKAVQKEGGFDAAAVGNVDRIVAQYRRELEAAGPRMSRATPRFRPPDGPSLAEVKKINMAWFEGQEEFYREANAIRDKFATQLKAALTSAQFDRLRQIAWQETETEALAYDEELAAALGLKPGQIHTIIAVNQDCVRKLRSLADGSMDKRLQLEKDRDNKAIQTLTPGQQEAFVKLKGKPFVVAQLRNQPAALDFGGDTFVVAPHGGIFSLAPDIWKELGLSLEAEAKAIAVKNQFNAAWRQAEGGLRFRMVKRPGGGRVLYQEAVPPWGLCFEQSQSNEERNEAIAGMMEKWHATISKLLPQLKEVLTADQFVRLQQIHWQALDTFAYSDPEVIEALAITNEQRERISAIANDYRARQQERFVQGGDGVREKINELAKERDKEINDVLTKAQLEKFAAMKGKEFDVNQLLNAAPVRPQGRGRPR